MLRAAEEVRKITNRDLQYHSTCARVTDVAAGARQRASVDTPLVQPVIGDFHASYHVQNTKPYENVREKLYTGCMVCGRSANTIKKEKVDWYVSRSKPRGEPEYITRIRKEAYEIGLNACAFLFITPAESQAASQVAGSG